jgi:hypothetical protein
MKNFLQQAIDINASIDDPAISAADVQTYFLATF